MRANMAVLLLAMAPPLLAQVPDPTRPPAQLMPPEMGAAAAAESGMQTVILRRHGKSGAVINGQYVEVGSVLGDKRVIRITEGEVVLQGGGGREVIRLIPSAAKTPIVKSSAQALSGRRTTGTTEK